MRRSSSLFSRSISLKRPVITPGAFLRLAATGQLLADGWRDKRCRGIFCQDGGAIMEKTMGAQEPRHEEKAQIVIVLSADGSEVGILGVVGRMIVEKVAAAGKGDQVAFVAVSF